MDPKETKAKIEEFWEWFVQDESKIRAFFEEEGEADKKMLIETINNKVLDFGMFAWDVAPGRDRQYAFTISPNGNKQRLALSQSIVYLAPKLTHWEFNPAKPAKDWDFQLNIMDDYLTDHTIDTSSWSFSLKKQSARVIDVTFAADNIRRFDRESKLQAAETAITNLLGEKNKIVNIGAIKFEDELQDLPKEESFSIERFVEQFYKEMGMAR